MSKPATNRPLAPQRRRGFTIGSAEFQAERPSGGLYLVATPIGNLEDVTVRALRLLAGADMIACEDTRITVRLLERYGITTPMRPYHDHNAAAERPKLIAAMAEGAAVALVCDAGTPLISDPGYKLVQAAVEAGVPVTAAPGASAALDALLLSALPSDSFFFAGFLPVKQAARRARLEALASVPATLIFYESPKRLAASLADMREVLGERPAAVLRELTKRFEEARRASLGELAEDTKASGAPKGEVVVVVGPPEEKLLSDAEVVALLRRALSVGSVKSAASEVARQSGRPRREMYARALALQDEDEETGDNGADTA